MAKKSKRPATKVTTVSVTPTTTRTEFNPDYTHVRKDLTRIGTLAGFFIVLLVALSFILR
ncbi:MAG TPA: hypothetical protein VFQ23_16680 [Anaerolineales bacterium]|nr:hypothetical protein [Anaerolineales bacterium]